MAKTKRRKVVPIETINRVLKILDRNDNDYSRTARETGFVRQTIMRWHRQVGLPAAGQLTPAEKEQKDSEDITVRRQMFEVSTLNTKEEILKRIDVAVKTSRSLNMLTKALKIVAEVENLSVVSRTKPLGGGNEPPVTNNTQVFLNTIINQIRISKKAKDGLTEG